MMKAFFRHILVTSLFCLAALPVLAGRDDRGIVSFGSSGAPFISRSAWMMGGSASYTAYTGDKDRNQPLDELSYRGYSVSARPAVFYAVADDLAIGGSFLYDRSFTDLDKAGLSIASIALNVNDYNALSQDFGLMFIGRKFLPMGSQGRFALYVDLAFSLGAGQGKITNRQTNGIAGTFQESWKAGIGVNPGLAAYITDRFSISAGVGIAGVEWQKVRQVHNQVANGSANGLSMSYSVNLLSLSVGAYFSF